MPVLQIKSAINFVILISLLSSLIHVLILFVIISLAIHSPPPFDKKLVPSNREVWVFFWIYIYKFPFFV